MALLGTLDTSVSAIDSFTQGLDTIGNNIANINSTAFKGRSVSFADTFAGIGTQVNGVTTDFGQGSLSPTGTATDLAIVGNGYFEVKNTVNGLTYATRDGQFHVDGNGYLVNQQGYRVQGLTGGASGSAPSKLGDIKVGTPPTKAVLQSTAIDSSGNFIETYSDGTQATTNQVLLQSFSDPNLLTSQGNNLFANLTAAGPLTATMDSTNAPGQGGFGTVQSGDLEQSNVDLTTQFANMITMERAFQANTRVVTVSDTVLDDIVNMKTH